MTIFALVFPDSAVFLYPDQTVLCLTFMVPFIVIYRVIHKLFRDLRPLRYSSRDGHSEGGPVNRGRGTPSFWPTLQVFDVHPR